MHLLRRKNTVDRPPSEATVARQKAEQDLRAIRAETPRFQALAESLREYRERNHLSENLTQLFRGGHA